MAGGPHGSFQEEVSRSAVTMTTLRLVALLGLGGALGTLARYGVGALLSRGFPWGTVVVNGVGSFALAFFMTAMLIRVGSEESRVFFAIAFLGAFTTMSAFAYESVVLLHEASFGRALLHFALNPLLSVASAGAGWACGRLLAG